MKQMVLGFGVRKTLVKKRFPADTTTSLDEARVFCRENRDDGCVCPCCGQNVRLYNYKFHSSLAQCLIGLVKVFETSQNWVHVKNIPVPGGTASNRGGHLAKAVHWGLIEAMPNEDAGKRTSGFWQPTQKGRDFVHGRIVIPKHVHLYNNAVHGFSAETTTIKEALGSKFSYEELLASKPS